jgi:TonB-linked SusC/RagA family outer membrane protein
MKKTLLLWLAIVAMLASNEAWAQERTISGRVTSSEDGTPLPGVNVVLKGTANGAVTDADGMYRLNVPQDGGTLVFSFIGLRSQEVAVGARTTVDVTMDPDITQLSEVVVTALGIEKTKNELAYAAQKVDGEQVAMARDNNFLNTLSGRVAGVDIKRNNSMGGSTNVVIRGYKSIYGNNQALFIVDGVPIDNSINNANTATGRANQTTGRGGYDYGNAGADINPDDIESINVLKGAAASALYGSRAANGVIMITTKKGRGKKGIGVTVNAGVTVGSIDKSTFAKYQKKYGQGYGPYYVDVIGSDINGDPIYYEDGPPSDALDPFFLNRDEDGDGDLDKITPTTEDAAYGAPYDPNLMVYQWDSYDPLDPDFGQPKPWVAAKNGADKFFETAVQRNYSVLLDGQTDKGYFKLGYTASDENGILPNSGLHKDFLNLGASYKITSKLTGSGSINVSKNKGLGRYGTGYDDKNLMTNFRQWWHPGVDIKEQEVAYRRNRAAGGTGNVTWNPVDPTDPTPIYWDNPYFTRYENFENDERLRYFGFAMLEYKPTNWLNIMGRVSLDTYNEFQEERQAFGSVTVSNYSRFNRSFSEYNYDLMANINKDFSEDFNLKALIGTNIRKTHTESIFAQTNGGLALPRLYTLSNTANPLEAPLETDTDLQVNGVFANATFGFRKLVFVDIAGRRDESSSLPDGENVYYYPSASLSFVFSELMPNSPWLTGGKLRANYAEVGNTAAPQSVLDTYDPISPFGSVPLFSVSGQKNNPNLKAERTKSSEIGLEMSFLDGRVGFDFTYYKSNTVDQIIPLPISRSTGYNFMVINAGDVENKGVELQMFGTPVQTDDFSWTVNVNWTRNRNKVVSLPEGIDNLQLGTFQGGVSLNATLGEPFGTIRGENFQFLNGKRVVGANGRYLRSATSNEVIGDRNPDWLGGINNKLTYKNLSLSFLIDIRKGGDIFNLDMYYGLATGLYPETAGKNDLGNESRLPIGDGGGFIYKDAVKADGTPNDIRVTNAEFGYYGYRRIPAAGFVYDGSYVKLREVALTFALPSNFVSKLGPITGIDFSIIGRNLWIISKNLPYADPEDGLSAGNLAQGYQGGTYPMVRNIGFNARFRF